ncbi:hypothetical protein QR680_004476 [Steinernema hermaphroditum]|uniref:Uncharacterized protein n=1 Tax=Steinernema hermaphroditum TaxID=289476 RepID=A0AA39HNT8_9BILA|nr:hypothetical protein QR680_004476 [Steinernema hermaphroditum]
MNCLLNFDVLASVLSEFDQRDFDALAGVHEEWKSLLVDSLKEESTINAYFVLEGDEWKYHFCSDRTTLITDHHQHQEKPSKKQTVDCLRIFGSESERLQYCCSKDERFPLDSLDSNVPLEFKSLEISEFSGSLEGLPSVIQKHFEKIVIDDSDLSDESNDVFLIGALKSSALKELVIKNSDVIASGAVQWQLFTTLESLKWEHVCVDEFWKLGDNFAVVKMLEEWLKEGNPGVRSTQCGFDNYVEFNFLWNRLAKLGEHGDSEIVVKHPKVEGLEAIISSSLDGKDQTILSIEFYQK